MLFQTLEAAFDENEDEDPDTDLGTDVYDDFVGKLKTKTIRVSAEAFEHIVGSDDGPEMVKMLVDSPAKAMRLFMKSAATHPAELERMLERTRKRAKKGEQTAEEKAAAAKKAADAKKAKGGDIMPDAGGGGNDAEEVDPSKMSQAEYNAWRKRQRESRGSGFFVNA